LRIYLTFSIIFLFIFESRSVDSLKLKKKNNFYKFLAAEGIVLAGGITYLSKQWYSDKIRVPFHFYNDFKGWNQVDKFGHFYASYIESHIGYSLMKKFNFSENKSLYLGGSQGLILETPIEFFDAYHDGWGFSLTDMVANAAGSLFFILQQKYFNNQIIKPKLSFSRSLYAREVNGYLGKNNPISEFLYDYNGHTYWFSFSPKTIFPNSKIPKWVNISLGYGSDGMIGEFTNIKSYKGIEIPDFKRFRQYYLSLDIDFSKIKTNSRFIKTVFKSISYLKIPLPTIELSQKKLKGHWIYF
tara:strand:- start:5708 stop:6604 length:897 start_codon:yes stop_codon:yes gene_type:complete